MPNSVADEYYSDLQVATALGTASLPRMDRAYWLGRIAQPETALFSGTDARYQALPTTNSIADKYYAWLATQPGGNIVGSVSDRMYAARVAGALP